MPTKIRIDNISEGNSYVIVSNGDYGAIAYHFQRNIGGNDPTDIGGSHAVWRRTGELGLKSVDDSVFGDRSAIAEDVGAFDYAFYNVSAGTWGGSYHGGETILSTSGTSLLKDAEVSSFSLSRTSRITYKNGVTIDMNLKQVINADGSFTETMVASSTSAFSQQLLGMEIGSGTGWTQVSTDGGENWQNLGSTQNYELGDIGEVILRNSATGQTIAVESNAVENPEFDHVYILRNGSRSKLYYEFGPGQMNEISATKTVAFGIMSASEAVNVVSSETYSMVALDTNLRLLGDQAINGVGNSRDNKLTGNIANNTLDGGAGNDLLNGGAGADKIVGGAGIDTATYAGAKSGVVARLGDNSANTNDAKGDTYSSIENLTGSSYADTFTGDKGNNRLSGGAGNDKLYGGLGNDLLIGGAGKDTFVFNTKLGATNIDTIEDFASKVDVIFLDDDIFTAVGKVGDLSADAFYAGAKAHDATDRIIYDQATGKLWYDADGNKSGVAIQFAQLEKGLTISASDFDVIA